MIFKKKKKEEEKFEKIHLPNGEFYLPWAAGQWDMLSLGWKTRIKARNCFNPLTTGNELKNNLMVVNIVAGDALVLKHQGISILNTEYIPIAPDHCHKKWWLS